MSKPDDIPEWAWAAAVAVEEAMILANGDDCTCAECAFRRTTLIARAILAAQLAERERCDAVRLALSEGLDLCVRARRMDEAEKERQDLYMRDPNMTRSLTIPLWAEDQYQTDLAAWEAKARSLMTLPIASAIRNPEGERG